MFGAPFLRAFTAGLNGRRSRHDTVSRLAQCRGQCLAAGGGHSGRVDEHSGHRGPVWGDRPEQVGGQHHHDGVHRLRGWCWSSGSSGVSRWASATRCSWARGSCPRSSACPPRRSGATAQAQAVIPLLDGLMPKFRFPESTLAYFQFVFAGDHAAAVLGQCGRADQLQGVADLRAAVVDVRLRGQRLPALGRRLVGPAGRARLQRRVRDPPGGRDVGVRGGGGDRPAAGPRPGRGRCPTTCPWPRSGAGLLWLGWNGFNGGDPYFAGADASIAVVNTNLATAVALLAWVAMDMLSVPTASPRSWAG